MEPNPVRTASHIGLWVIVIGIGVWLIYAATHTNTENNRYGSGTTPITHETRNYGLVNFTPCGAFFSIGQPEKKMQTNAEVKTK